MAPQTRQKVQTVKGKKAAEARPKEAPAPKKRVRAPAKAARAEKKQRVDHGPAPGENEGQNGSRDSSESPGRALGLEKAKLGIRREADDMCKLIEKQLREELRFDYDLSPMEELFPELALAIPRPGSKRPATPPPLTNEIYIKARRCLETCDDIVSMYEEICRRPTGVKAPKWAQWLQDVNDLKALNQSAVGVSVEALNAIIMPRPKEREAPDPGKGNGFETLAGELLAEALEAPEQETWGTAAQGLLKAISEAAKLLPDEADHESD